MGLPLGGDLQPTVISVVGMSGLDKTTMVLKLFDDGWVKNAFHYSGVSELSHSPELLGIIYQLFR